MRPPLRVRRHSRGRRRRDPGAAGRRPAPGARRARGAAVDWSPTSRSSPRSGVATRSWPRRSRPRPTSRCWTSRCPAWTASRRPRRCGSNGPPAGSLVVTTFGRPGYLRRAMAAGASGFMVKDAPAEQLADAIRRVRAGLRVVDPALAAETLATGESPLTDRERDVLVAAREAAPSPTSLVPSPVGGDGAQLPVRGHQQDRRAYPRRGRPAGDEQRLALTAAAPGDNGAVTTGWQLLERAGVPVVLAPMAGITNRAFRRLAREQAERSRRRHRRRRGHLRHRDGHVAGPCSSATPRPSRWSRSRPGREPAQRPALRRRPPRSWATRCGCSSTRTAPTTST